MIDIEKAKLWLKIGEELSSAIVSALQNDDKNDRKNERKICWVTNLGQGYIRLFSDPESNPLTPKALKKIIEGLIKDEEEK